MRFPTPVLAAALMASPLPALAQTTTDPSVSTAAAVPATWDAGIRETFFADAEATEFRSASDVRERFSALSEELQAQVQRDCNTIIGSRSDAGVAADISEPEGEQLTQQPPGGPEEITSMNGLCTVVEGL